MSGALRELLPILVCPRDHQPLHMGDDALLQVLNAAVKDRSLRQRDGSLVHEPLEAALVTEDRAWAYPVRGGVPELLVGSALAL